LFSKHEQLIALCQDKLSLWIGKNVRAALN
jgi:hypothetical protein